MNDTSAGKVGYKAAVLMGPNSHVYNTGKADTCYCLGGTCYYLNECCCEYVV